MTRLLREQGVTVSRRTVTNEEAAEMKREYAAGATMAQLEAKYRLSHGAVYRPLHQAGA
jgi:Mor family transcriptional regulator